MKNTDVNDNPVKEICIFMNISQLQLSRLMGVSEGTVNRWSSSPDKIPDISVYFIKVLISNVVMIKEIEKYRLLKSLLKD